MPGHQRNECGHKELSPQGAALAGGFLLWRRKPWREGGHIGPPLQGGLLIEGWARETGGRLPPLRDILPGEGQFRENGRGQIPSPTEVGLLQPPGERQRKEEGVDSTTSKPPLALRRGLETFVSNRRHFLRAPVFSLPPCTAHSLFSQKREWGCIAPAIAGIQSSPPVRASKGSPLRGSNQPIFPVAHPA